MRSTTVPMKPAGLWSTPVLSTSNFFTATATAGLSLARNLESIMLPLVSIVAPVYNESKTMPELVRRLAAVCGSLEERYRFEFILVDDGSGDRTLEIGRELIVIEPRLRIIELRRNFGQTQALQAGLACATGE